jgi:colicin import membrane protein
MATQDDAAKKAAEDAAKKAEEDAAKAAEGKIDPTIAALIKDPDAIADLLKTKREANAEAKAFRLKLEAKEKAETEAKEAALKEQGKFKELAESAKAEKDKAVAGFKKRLADLTLKNEAIALNSIDPDLVVLAVDRAGIKVSDDLETVEGAKEAVAALAKAKPHLFEEVKPGIPPPGTPKPHLKGILQPAAGESPRDRITRGLDGKSK